MHTLLTALNCKAHKCSTQNAAVQMAQRPHNHGQGLADVDQKQRKDEGQERLQGEQHAPPPESQTEATLRYHNEQKAYAEQQRALAPARHEEEREIEKSIVERWRRREERERIDEVRAAHRRAWKKIEREAETKRGLARRQERRGQWGKDCY